MKISSADFTRLTLQEVADLLIDRQSTTVICKGLVDN